MAPLRVMQMIRKARVRSDMCLKVTRRLADFMMQQSYVCCAAPDTESTVQLTHSDVALLRSSVFDLSRSLLGSGKMRPVQQHAPSDCADTAAPQPGHPLQSFASARVSSSHASGFSESLATEPPCATSQQPMLSPSGSQRQRVSRPLSVRPSPESAGLAAPPFLMSAQHQLPASATPGSAANDRDFTAIASVAEDSRPVVPMPTASEVVEGLGKGTGIMRQLWQRLAGMQGQEAAMLRDLLGVLGRAEARGVDLSPVFTSALASEARGLVTRAVPVRQVSNTVRTGRATDRGGEVRAAPNEWRLRLLAGYEDAKVIGLTGIALFDDSSKQCALASQATLIFCFQGVCVPVTDSSAQKF